MTFIKKLEITADTEIMLAELNELLKTTGWPEEAVINGRGYPSNQLGVTYRPGAELPWLDATGSLYNKHLQKFIGEEKDFTEWNPIGPYTLETLNRLSVLENIKFGRVRYMRMMPKTGLSIHTDAEERYHFVLETNKHALFGEYTGDEDVAAKCYHIPACGHFYKVDTTVPHFVYNGGWEPRIHLVICPL